MPCRQVINQKVSASSSEKTYWPFITDSIYFTNNTDTNSLLFLSDTTFYNYFNVPKTAGNPDCKPDSLSFEKMSREFTSALLPFTTQFDLFNKTVSIQINQQLHLFPFNKINNVDSIAFAVESWNNHDFEALYLSVIGADSVYYNTKYGLVRFASPSYLITLKP
jgi:hypothetical protein